MNRLSALLAAALLFSAPLAPAGLVVTQQASAPTGSDIALSNTNQDFSGNTRIWYRDADKTLESIDGVNGLLYYNRDRDLGQTFRTGTSGFYLDAITLRIGATATAVRDGALGAGISLQLLQVTGSPVINNNGTTQAQGAKWDTFNPTDGRTDDYITGETYTHLAHATGGTVPLTAASNAYLRFDLTGASQIFLNPNTTYAFMVMFDEAAPDRGLAFANAFFGNYSGGHALRREGNGEPYFNEFGQPFNSAMTVEDVDDPDDMAAALAHASLPADLTTRLNQQPGTLGVPDVDTYRDFVFFIHASPIPEPSTYALLGLALAAALARRLSRRRNA